MDEAYDLIIEGGTVVTADSFRTTTVAVKDGKVAALLDPESPSSAKRTIDATGLHILPGIIDTHVHLRSPGNSEREDVVSGTGAAAAGGITTLMEMPISTMPANTAEGVHGRAEAFDREALIDFGLYGAAGHENIDRIPEIAEAGVLAFKTFLTPPPAHREGEFFGLWCLDYADMQNVMAATAQTGLRHSFHCENYPMLDTMVQRLSAEGRTDGPAHAESRPSIVEDTSVAIMMAIATYTGGPVEVVHLSSPNAAQLVREAKDRGLDVIAETCPQYLCMTDQALADHGGLAKCNPALRTADEVERLWPYLLDDTIDFIGSDHSPFLRHEKQNSDIFKVPPGCPGLESMVPLMLTAVNQGRFTLTEMVKKMSTRAAEVFGLNTKGQLATGFDADLVLIDMSERWTFDMHACFSKSSGSMDAVHGRDMHGKVVSTFVRGVPIYESGEIIGKPGHGNWLKS
jgi:allantoinase